MTTVIFGCLPDPTVAYVCTRLQERRKDFVLFDPRNYPSHADVTWTVLGGAVNGAITYGSRRVGIEEIRSIYVRSTRTQTGSGDRTNSDYDPERLLRAFVETAPVLVVNRPSACVSNFSKPFQQQIIARHFSVPRTLVTTEPDQVSAFYAECTGRVIYKSVSWTRSIVRRLTTADLERVEDVCRCPTQFQEYIAGTEIRAHVVGSRVFATEIATDAVDYRYAGRDGLTRRMRACELPAEIADRCRQLTAALGLSMAGVDLRRTPRDEYYCFEANVSPGFTFFESQTGQRIGEALIDLLVQGAPDAQ